jgi:hypothetical protein
MDCSLERNESQCTCTYVGCDKRGRCCECVAYHRDKEQLPGCFFSKEGEKTYDRSFRRFIMERT